MHAIEEHPQCANRSSTHNTYNIPKNVLNRTNPGDDRKINHPLLPLQNFITLLRTSDDRKQLLGDAIDRNQIGGNPNRVFEFLETGNLVGNPITVHVLRVRFLTLNLTTGFLRGGLFGRLAWENG